MNVNKIDRLFELQARANRQIDTYGEAEDSVINELMELTDTLTEEEESEVARRFHVGGQ